MSSTTLSARPMTVLGVDFPELYARHLCRHSQLGINVTHLAALFGVWFGVYGALLALTGAWWLPAALAAAYLGLVAVNAPPRVLAATVGFLAGFLAAVYLLPALPLWAYLLMVPVCYEVQALSHKVWTRAADMTEFDRKYPKGWVRFVVLLVNEVPMLLNFLVFDRKSWRA